MPYSAIRSLSAKPKVVLYADDETNDIVLFKYAAKRLRCQLDLHFVRTGDEAIDWMNGEEPYADRFRFPKPDVLLTDLKMPGRSGFDVLVWVRSQPQFQHLPVILYSTSILAQDKITAQRLGATKFITKTTHCNEVIATLSQCLNCATEKVDCFSRCPGSQLGHLSGLR